METRMDVIPLLQEKNSTDIILTNSQEDKKTNNTETQRLSPLEVLDQMDDYDDFCPMTLSTPIIPYYARDNSNNRFPPNKVYELAKLLRLLLIEGSRANPLNRQDLFVADIGTVLIPHRKLIEKVDQELNRYGYTRQDLLKQCAISPALYAYLLNLNLGENRLQKLIQRCQQYRLSPIIKIGLTLGLIYLYEVAFSSYVCLNTQLDQGMYTAVLNTFNKQAKFSLSDTCSLFEHDHAIEQSSNFYVCEGLGGQVIRINGIPGSRYYTNEMLYASDPIKDKFLSIICCAIGSTAITQNYCLTSRSNLTRLSRIFLLLYMTSIFLIGMDALTDCFGLWDLIMNRFYPSPSLRFSCAKACNDGFYRRYTYENQTYEVHMPETSLPVCDTFPNMIVSGIGLLTAPITFFGSRLVKLASSCRRRSQGQIEFEQLGRERNFDYTETKSSCPSPI